MADLEELLIESRCKLKLEELVEVLELLQADGLRLMLELHQAVGRSGDEGGTEST